MHQNKGKILDNNIIPGYPIYLEYLLALLRNQINVYVLQRFGILANIMWNFKDPALGPNIRIILTCQSVAGGLLG